MDKLTPSLVSRISAIKQYHVFGQMFQPKNGFPGGAIRFLKVPSPQFFARECGRSFFPEPHHGQLSEARLTTIASPDQSHQGLGFSHQGLGFSHQGLGSF